MTIHDYQTGESVTVEPAVPTGRLRVELVKLTNEIKVNEAQKHLMTAALTIGEENKSAVIAHLMQQGQFSVDDLINANVGNIEEVEHNLTITAKMFQKVVDRRKLAPEWCARIDDVEFIKDQNIKEVEAFVDTFLRLVGVRQ